MTETTDELCHECRRSLADVEAEFRGRPYRMLLIGLGGPTQINHHDRRPGECQRVLARQQFQSSGLVENRTVVVEGDWPNSNSPSAGGPQGVQGALTAPTGLKLADMKEHL